MDNQRDRYTFLGREFLTWLWYESERNQGRVETPSFGSVGVEFGQRLTLETGGNVREGSTVSAEAPSQAEEARTALRVGKKVSRARLLLDTGEEQFSLNLDAETLTFAGVKLPSKLDPKDGNLIEERLLLLDRIEGLIGELYVGFVRLRMDEAQWGPVREAMRAWVAQGSAEA